MKGVEAYVQSYNGKKAVIGSEIKYISGATLTISRNLLEIVVNQKLLQKFGSFTENPYICT